MRSKAIAVLRELDEILNKECEDIHGSVTNIEQVSC